MKFWSTLVSSDTPFKVQAAERVVSLLGRVSGAVLGGLSSFLEPCNCERVSKIGLCLTDITLNGTQDDFWVLDAI